MVFSNLIQWSTRREFNFFDIKEKQSIHHQNQYLRRLLNIVLRKKGSCEHILVNPAGKNNSELSSAINQAMIQAPISNCISRSQRMALKAKADGDGKVKCYILNCEHTPSHVTKLQDWEVLGFRSRICVLQYYINNQLLKKFYVNRKDILACSAYFSIILTTNCSKSFK